MSAREARARRATAARTLSMNFVCASSATRVSEFWSVTCDAVTSSARPSTVSCTLLVRAKKAVETSWSVRRSCAGAGVEAGLAVLMRSV